MSKNRRIFSATPKAESVCKPRRDCAPFSQIADRMHVQPIMIHWRINRVLQRIGILLVAASFLLPIEVQAFNTFGSAIELMAEDWQWDSTDLIQDLLDDDSYTRIILYPGPEGRPWFVRPLHFSHDNTWLQLANGTQLSAKNGGFPDRGDCLIEAIGKSNIKITGSQGASLLMRKWEYADLEESEHRHALCFRNCHGVRVEGLEILYAGGDGVYIGGFGTSGYCSDVTIANIVADGCARNGVSIISVKNLSIRDCTFKNTGGVRNCGKNGPWAGIDLEPNHSGERLENISIKNCDFVNNKALSVPHDPHKGFGLLLSTHNLEGSTKRLNLRVTNCNMIGNQQGIHTSYLPGSLSSDSYILFEGCGIYDNQTQGVYVGSKGKDAGLMEFKYCDFSGNCHVKEIEAILVYTYSDTTEISGRINFYEVNVDLPPYVPYAIRVLKGEQAIVQDVRGFINSQGLLYAWNESSNTISIR